MVVSIFWISASGVLAGQELEYPELLRVASGICPQPRTTREAPSNYIHNPPFACYFQKYSTREKTLSKGGKTNCPQNVPRYSRQWKRALGPWFRDCAKEIYLQGYNAIFVGWPVVLDYKKWL